ncbi:hypothetical protein [Domibacillus robiginosus]|nr:hypothetical protein [Domibacillus robiginosus]
MFAPYITSVFTDAAGKRETGFYLSETMLIIKAIMFLFTDNKSR